MKELAFAGVLILLPAAASAGTLVAGAVRDADGYVVAGAALEAFGAAEQPLGRAVTSPDGTFALDAGAPPATLEVHCEFCVPQRVKLTGEPLAIVVVRFAALRDRTPSPDDIIALPYGRATAIASLVPYAVVSATSVSDRALNGVRGATLIDGIPYYRPTDGYELLDLLPLRNIASLSVQPPAAAPLYGPYAAGGTFDIGTQGETSIDARGGGSGAATALRAGGQGAWATLGESTFGNPVRRATGAFEAPFGAGRLSLAAAAAGGAYDNAAGARLGFTAAAPRFDAGASITASQSRAIAGYAPVSGSNVRADVHVRGRGPAATELGARVQQSTGSDDRTLLAGAQAEAAVYADVRTTSRWGSLFAAVAFQQDALRASGRANASTMAILPSFAGEVRLGEHFTLHGSATAALRDAYVVRYASSAAPAPFVRSSVIDASLSYTDGRRLRVDAVAYAQRSRDATDQVAGVGLDAVWQITPQLALRSWSLAASAGAPYNGPAAVYGYAAPAVQTTLRRNVAWITYRNGVRVDIIARGAGLDGSLGIPISRQTTLLLGTYGLAPGRVATVGVRFR